MILMNTLRMMADISFLFAFGGYISMSYGGSGAFIPALLQCICFGLSRLGGKRWYLRVLFLLPMALDWYLCRNSVADMILITPSALYILYQVLADDYVLNHERQRQLFKAFLCALPFFVVAIMASGRTARLAAVTFPYAIVMLSCSVLLLRALRHEPEVYCKKSFQLLSIGIMAAILILGFLMSTDVFLNACAVGLRAFKNHVLQPTLIGILYVALFIMQLPAKLIDLLFGDRNSSGPSGYDLEGIFPEEMEDLFDPNEPSDLLRYFGIAAGVLAAVIVLFFIFRWMSKKRYGGPVVLSTDGQRSSIITERPVDELQSNSSVGNVRLQYRKFLKLCASQGVVLEPSTTSQDVHVQASRTTVLEKVSGPIREIYIQARYAGKADKSSVQQIKKLYAEGKKNRKNTEA